MARSGRRAKNQDQLDNPSIRTSTVSTDTDSASDTIIGASDKSRSTTRSSSATLINTPIPTRTPSPEPTSETGLRKRVSTIPSDIYHSRSSMFGSRKYTPLPTNGNQQQRRRAGGGMPTWKRWALIGGAVSLVVLLGYSQIPSRKAAYESYGGENETYTPSAEYEGEYDVTAGTNDGEDLSMYETPPFSPGLSDEEDEEEEQMVHIQPIDESNMEENVQEWPEDDVEFQHGGKTSSPHDPTHPDAIGAHKAKPDFSEITTEDDTVDTPATGLDDGETSNLATSFETDPDASSTTACVEPYDATKPLVQYALTIDAGSTGSRIHVYKFHNCGTAPELEYETFKAVNPGLSAFATDPTAAAASLDPLLFEAQRVIPKNLHGCTPVEVKATAGLRLLGAAESDAILDEVRNRLESNFKFVVGGDASVEIMDGKDEGVYAWITANYLAKKIGEGVVSDDTLAVMDLGGASTQIVFEPKFPSTDDTLAEGEHKYALKFGGKEFTLYQHSYLGYGLMRARRSVHNLIAFTHSFGSTDVQWDDMTEDVTISNPCLTSGSTRIVELDPPGRKSVSVTMHGGNGGFAACDRVVQLVMAKDAICEVKPCSFNGVYQPSLLSTFPRGQFLALSYFTDRIKPLLSGQKAKYTKSTTMSASTLSISDLADLATDVCAGPAVWKKRWNKGSEALAELADRPEYCLDLTFMHALLGLGYELGSDRELVVEKKIRGVELGWALGAGLALVQNAQLTCTA